MNKFTSRSNVRNLWVAAAASGMTLAALASPECYVTFDVQPACSMGSGCDTSAACADIEVHSNEMVKTTQTGGNRKLAVSLDFLCHVTWKEQNLQGECVVEKLCHYTVQGNVASGGLCVGSGGGGRTTALGAG